jgi:hypothetical protein
VWYNKLSLEIKYDYNPTNNGVIIYMGSVYEGI